MRHNHSLSYRSAAGRSLALFAAFWLFFMFSGIQPVPVYGQSKQVKKEDKVAGAPEGVQLKKGDQKKVPGQGFDEEDFRPKVEEESYGWLVFKTIIVLAMLIGGFYMFYVFITKKAGVNIAGQDVVQTLSVVPLGPGKFLYVIDIAGRVFLLGVSENSINMLTEIEGKEDIDRIRLLSSRSTPGEGKTFQDMVSGQIGRFVDKINERKIRKSGAVPGHEDDDGFDISYLSSQRKRLEKINGKDDE